METSRTEFWHPTAQFTVTNSVYLFMPRAYLVDTCDCYSLNITLIRHQEVGSSGNSSDLFTERIVLGSRQVHRLS
jgi:hypothetical protein